MKPPPAHIAPNIKRYEPIFRQLCRRHAAGDYRGVKFNPKTFGQSARTAVARFPETVSWILSTGLWLDESEIWKHYHCVVTDDEWVSIEPRRKPEECPSDILPTQRENDFVLLPTDRLFTTMIEGCAAMLSARIIRGAITIRGRIDPELKLLLESKYDIAFREEPDGTTTML